MVAVYCRTNNILILGTLQVVGSENCLLNTFNKDLDVFDGLIMPKIWVTGHASVIFVEAVVDVDSANGLGWFHFIGAAMDVSWRVVVKCSTNGVDVVLVDLHYGYDDAKDEAG